MASSPNISTWIELAALLLIKIVRVTLRVPVTNPLEVETNSKFLAEPPRHDFIFVVAESAVSPESCQSLNRFLSKTKFNDQDLHKTWDSDKILTILLRSVR